MDSDLEALHKAARGDEAGLNELMARHQEALHRFAYRYLGNAADADEVVQETFVRAWFKAGSFQPRGKVRTWLFSIAANLCRDRLRLAHRRISTLPVDEERTAQGQAGQIVAASDSRTAARDDLQRLQAEIHRLPHKLKAALILCVLEGHSHEEAATLLGVSTKAVELSIYRARKQLRERLEN